jgi:hypothetical protein
MSRRSRTDRQLGAAIEFDPMPGLLTWKITDHDQWRKQSEGVRQAVVVALCSKIGTRHRQCHAMQGTRRSCRIARRLGRPVY